MIVKKLSDVAETENHIKADTWDSVRMLLAKDGMGFGFHITTMYASTETKMQYLNHLECVYCISGEAEIEDLKSGTKHLIKSGSMYALNEHDHHVVRCKTDLVIACVFSPGLMGNETHDASGAYPKAQ
ncbi:L-ectoine synthase [compost metagenome]|uniref:ectoine synthase n=1 Tax=unclassified Pseudomonas TaxID=196821 RepID=UPI000FADD85A|nr:MULTISPECIES: ectoine synthase [unclassified Pseudomonas]